MEKYPSVYYFLDYNNGLITPTYFSDEVKASALRDRELISYGGKPHEQDLVFAWSNSPNDMDAMSYYQKKGLVTDYDQLTEEMIASTSEYKMYVQYFPEETLTKMPYELKDLMAEVRYDYAERNFKDIPEGGKPEEFGDFYAGNMFKDVIYLILKKKAYDVTSPELE